MTGRRVLTLVAALLVTLQACASVGPSGTDRPGSASKPADLTPEWSWASPEGYSPGLPAADGEGAAVTWSHQVLVVFDRHGAPQWRAGQPDFLEVAPALTPDLVVAATKGALTAYDRASGRVRWQSPVGGEPATPVVSGTRVVTTTWEGMLVVFDAGDGRVVWRAELGGPSIGPAAVAATGAVVVTFDSGRAAGASAFDLATGAPRWSVPLPADGVSAPAVSAGGVVVVIAADSAAHGLSVADGAEMWRAPLDGSGSPEVPPLALPDGDVVVAHRLGGMAQLDGNDGTVRWESAPHGAAVRGGPAGPGPGGWFAMPLHDGLLLLAGPGRRDGRRTTPGLVRGVARRSDGTLLVSVGRGTDNRLVSFSGW